MSNKNTSLFRSFIVQIGTLVLLSCAPSTLNELRTDPSGVYEFEVNDNYQRVYRTLAEQARECWSTGYLLSPQASNVIDADLFNELGEAQIVWRMENFGSNYYALAEIKNIDIDQTNVKLYYSFSTLDYLGPLVEKWTAGYSNCS